VETDEWKDIMVGKAVHGGLDPRWMKGWKKISQHSLMGGISQIILVL